MLVRPMNVVVVLQFLLLFNMCYGQSSPSTSPEPTTPTTEPVIPKLKCWGCNGIGPNNECDNYSYYQRAYENMEDDKEPSSGNVELLTCTAPYNVTCSIITYSTSEGEVAHLRGCSDDKTFGFPKEKWDRYTILKNTSSDNTTKCAFDGEDLVCLTKCNDTDYCNGPQLGAGSIHVSLLAMMANFAIFLYFCINVTS